jgi:hypothetical protein
MVLVGLVLVVFSFWNGPRKCHCVRRTFRAGRRGASRELCLRKETMAFERECYVQTFLGRQLAREGKCD